MTSLVAMYPGKIRAGVALLLVLALLGSFNEHFLGYPFAGLPPEKVAILAFIPLALAIFCVITKWGVTPPR